MIRTTPIAVFSLLAVLFLSALLVLAEEAAGDSPVTAAEAPEGEVRVPATKEGLGYIGAKKCKICHKVQYASWEESAHASLDPPLDCESCHGPGSEYKSMKVMKDPEAARAAGMVNPGVDFCTRCHQAEGFVEEMLQTSHAHKEDEG